VDGSAKAACWPMSVGVGRGLPEFGVIWLGSKVKLSQIGEVDVYFATHKAKNHETHLVLVGFERFQHRSLFYYQFASVGMGDAVGWATTGGEWGWGGLGDACARIFSLAMVSVAVGKAVMHG